MHISLFILLLFVVCLYNGCNDGVLLVLYLFVLYFEVKNGCNVYIILLSVLAMSLHSCLLTVFCVHYLVWCLVFAHCTWTCVY